MRGGDRERSREGESRLTELAAAVLGFLAGKWWGARSKGATTPPEPPPAPPPKRTKPEELVHILMTPVRRRDRERRRQEELSPRKPDTAPAKKGAEEAKSGESGLSGVVVKVLGAIAAGIGITGAVVVVGAAIFWARFDAMGIPPVQAVTVIPRTELLVQGGQEMVLFVLVALGATLLIALSDPKGVTTLGTLGVLVLLVGGAAAYAICTTLCWAWVLFLIALTLLFALVAVCVGFATGQRLLPLLVSVFILAFVFSATSAFLIVETQKYAQAIAIRFDHKEGDDKGLTGIYVTVTEKTVYYARTDLGGEADAGLYEVPRSEATTYAIGPLEPLEKSDGARPVEERGTELLASLKKDAENFPPPEAEASKDEGTTTAK